MAYSMEELKTVIGENLVKLRRGAGLTQSQLAEKLGYTDKAVSKWERDQSCPDVGSLPRLAEVLGISLDELMQVEPNGKETGGAVGDMVLLVCKAVALAMGVAVTVLSALEKLDFQAAAGMLGIGLACVGIVLLNDRETR